MHDHLAPPDGPGLNCLPPRTKREVTMSDRFGGTFDFNLFGSCSRAHHVVRPRWVCTCGQPLHDHQHYHNCRSLWQTRRSSLTSHYRHTARMCTNQNPDACHTSPKARIRIQLGYRQRTPPRPAQLESHTRMIAVLHVPEANAIIEAYYYADCASRNCECELLCRTTYSAAYGTKPNIPILP